jgi:C-terminal processing protease CtpA/Prc
MIFASFLLAGCKDDDPSPSTNNIATSNDTTTYVNHWILDNMNFWYLWYDKIPAKPDKNLDPESFFKSLLYSEDRFSWIQPNYIDLLNSLQGVSKEAGYEFALYRESSSSNHVIAQVLYIKPNSPAASSGLKRGDVITHINDQQITTSNYSTLVDAMHENHSIRYRPLDLDQQTFLPEQTLNLSAVEYSEDPNYLSKVINAGNNRIGYYVYNFFASGTDTDSTQYDREMENIFNSFKTSGITDLVLDLRFNSGGSEVSATNLASEIAPDANSSKIFFKREYNKQVQQEIMNDPSASDSFLVSHFSNKGANVGNQLNGNRIYVLTSSRTASASELIINGLKPYMNVFIIGDTTYGKNVGSISLYEENDPKNTWGMQPIVVKAYNSLDQSDYSQGFVPDIEDQDDDLILYPLGDTREELLSKAITQITGAATIGRAPSGRNQRQLIGHSLDYKKRSFNLVVKPNIAHRLSSFQ